MRREDERLAAIHDEDAFLAAMVSGSDDAIVTKLLDGTVRTWNTGAERLFGYTADEMVGQPIYIVVPPDRHEEERGLLERLGRGERIEHFETVRRAKSGRLVNVSLTISPIRGSNGQLIGASKIARDITARTLADEALRLSEERFRTLADNMTQLAWTCDPQGVATWYNRRWYDYTGTTWEAMRGGDGRAAVSHPDHADRVRAGFQRALVSETPWEDAFPLRGADGRYRWFLSRAVPIRNEHGAVVSWFGTNTDITAQRDAEDALREANRQKDLFLAILGHELRNPLAAIRHATSLLESAAGNTPLIARTHAILERQGRHMGTLIDGLLDLSRIGEGRITLQLDVVDLVEVCRVACADMQVRSSDRQLAYTTRLPSAPVYVEGDRTRLVQIMDNLLSNAVQNTADGGTIEAAIARDGEHVALTVRDTGAGIAAQDLVHIFEPFRQAADASVHAHGGLGLGLALVRSLVQLHHGDVRVSSDGPGCGAEFVVRLPLTAKRPAAADPFAEDTPARRILIIEDNRDASEMLQQLLTFQGHQVRVAASGEEGIEAFRAERPDVVLCDLGLPGALSGFAVARALRGEASAGNVRLVAVSGYGLPEDKAQSSEAGFDEHLTKPIELDKLARVIGADSVAL